MVNLDQRRIKFVKSIPIEVRAKVLYQFLNKSTSNRNIERMIDELAEEDGWQAWSIIHFYGFDGSHKGRYSKVTLKSIKEQLYDFNEHDIEEFHLIGKEKEEDNLNIVINENDGKNVLRQIKTRVGQSKLRRILLANYNSQCALCSISNPKLLVTSHIKRWADSLQREKMDPQNSILLCKLHDSLFEHGFISLSSDYKVLYSSTFDFENQGLSKALFFKQPLCDAPSDIFLGEHRKRHGFK